MLCHLADQLRVALGDARSAPVHNLVARTLVRHLVVNTGFRPPRGRIETAPERLATQPRARDADLEACVALIERIGRGDAAATHPTFGPLSPSEWGRLCWKHLDHHLVQFGA